MARDVTIRVIATDQASPVFRTIGQNAAQATNTIDQGNQRAARSYEDLERRAVAVGAAIGTLALGMAAAGQAAAEQEQQVRGIEVAYGDAADELLKFAEHMQDVTNFSNDAARQAELTAATITQQYGIATDQVDDLVMRSADLAQVFGYDLADATSRVTSAIRGEAEAAEALGVAMSDTALQAYAAANGMTGWNTTMTEAEKAQVRFQVLMEQTAYVSGEAQRAHESTRGTVMELANEFQDAGAKVGEFLGPLGETMSVLGNMSLILPVVGAGLGKLVTGLGAAGLTPGMLGPAALLLGGASLAYGYSQDDIGTTNTNQFWNEFFLYGSKFMNTVLPGDPYNEQKYIDQMSENAIGDLIMSYFALPGDDANAAVTRANAMLGNPAFNNGEVFNYDADDLKQYIADQASARGLKPEAWLQEQIQVALQDPAMMINPATGGAVSRKDYLTYLQGSTTTWNMSPGTSGLANAPQMRISPAANPTAGTWRTTTGQYLPREFGTNPMLTAEGDAIARSMYALAPYSAVPGRNFIATSGDTAIGGDIGGMDAGTRAGATERTEDPGWFPKRTGTANPQADFAGYAESIKSVTQALIEQYPAYEGLITGINSASDAQKAFKATQDGLLESQTVYTQQISEFSSQVNAQDAAYEILQKRQEDGIALTEEQTEFMNNYAEANARGTEAVEGATISAGMLAQQYLLNLEQGNAMHAMLAGQTEETGNLVDAIELLILSLNGIPDEVRTKILLDNDQALSDLNSYLGLLWSVPGTISTAMDLYGPGLGTSVNNFLGGGMHGLTAYANGGTAYDPLMPRFANGGGVYALVGEVGPELVKLPGGAQVMPTGASQDQMRRMRRGTGGSQFANYGIVNLQAPTGDAFDALAGSVMGDVW
ncbi:MAG: hypothetical protein IT337_17560 [Thermomicrobiales bacterium]|nr:hypothetical protein [Thermomicrobiales bacterium]